MAMPKIILNADTLLLVKCKNSKHNIEIWTNNNRIHTKAQMGIICDKTYDNHQNSSEGNEQSALLRTGLLRTISSSPLFSVSSYYFPWSKQKIIQRMKSSCNIGHVLGSWWYLVDICEMSGQIIVIQKVQKYHQHTFYKNMI